MPKEGETVVVSTYYWTIYWLFTMCLVSFLSFITCPLSTHNGVEVLARWIGMGIQLATMVEFLRHETKPKVDLLRLVYI
jgi:hypothetical protein